MFREIGCSTAVLTVHDLRTSDLKLHVSTGMDEEWIEQTPRYGTAMLDIWGGAQRVASYPLEEPIVQSRATPRWTWLSNPWFCEMGLPRGFHDVIGVALVRNSRTLGAIAFGVHQDLGEVTDDTLAAVRLIAPHFRRAVTIGRLFEQEAAAAVTFSEVIDGVAAGVVLVDGDFQHRPRQHVGRGNAEGRRPHQRHERHAFDVAFRHECRSLRRHRPRRRWRSWSRAAQHRYSRSP
ncbi:MAG: hypothetical protein WDN31_22950 [Hyphomicrobium sp.]